MRVLQVMECTIGGTRRHLRDLCHGLLRRGVQLQVACAALREPAVRKDMAGWAAAGAEVTEVPMVRAIRPLTDLSHAAHLGRLMAGRDLDVVHTHSSKAGALGRVAALMRSGAARIHTPHTFAFAFEGGVGQGGEAAGPRGLILSTERLLGRFTQRMLHVSEGEREDGQQLGIIARGRTRVVPNGIDPTEFARPTGGPALRAELGIPDGAPVVGSVGLLNDAKGYDVLLDALALMDRDVHAVVLGHGEREQALTERAHRLGLAERWHLAGWRDEVHSAHDAFDVFVLSSRWEGMSYALMEAMAAGLPCVSTAVNGSDTLLGGEDGRDPPCGALVPREDPAALAAALTGLLADRARAAEWGSRSAARIAQRFTLEHMLDRTLAVYEDVATSS